MVGEVYAPPSRAVNRASRACQSVSRQWSWWAPGDVRDSQADITRARRLLGYEPAVGFEEGLKKTVDWYRTSQVTVA